MKWVAVAAAAILVAACASQPKPYLASDVHVIAQEDLEDYWVMENESVRFRAPLAVRPVPCGRVVLEYIIDSNGNVFNARIVESQPRGVYDAGALKNISLRNFVPAAGNPQRIPVKVTEETTFREKDAEC